MTQLTLYHFDGCPYCRRVEDFLTKNKISVPMKDIRKDLGAREELIRIGGKPQVPCLVIGDKALYESLNIIETAMPQTVAHVSDPNHDGEHFEALVISPTFEGMALVKQHQVVLGALKEAFAGAVHALKLKTFTPAKWNEVKNQYLV